MASMKQRKVNKMFYRTDDPLRDFDRYDSEQQRNLDMLPKCDICGEPIQDDYCYEINDELICHECLEANYKKRID